MYQHILVALDGSAAAESVLPYVEALAGKFGSRVTLLRSSTPAEAVALEEATAGMPPVVVPALDPQKIADDEARAARAYLADVARRFSTLGLAVEVDVPVAPA